MSSERDDTDPPKADPASGLGWLVVLGIGGLVLTVVMVGLMMR